MPQFSAAAPKRFCHLRFCRGVYNLSMKKGVMLGALLLASVGMAGRMPDNLKPFQKVCVNAYYAEGEEKDDDVAVQLINRIEAALKKAKIAVVAGQCQDKGLVANKQLNLYFSYVTTEDLTVSSGILEGWLKKDGAYQEPTLWWDNLFGSLDEGSVPLQAADALDTLLEGFIADWKKSH